ncbi:MAG: alcohol dehydrogenase catalytic domain-containing protein, partial [Rhodospirillaceae bacterium]
MRAVGFKEFGGPEVLQVIDVPEVHPGPGEIRIKNHAATVNPTDLLARNGSRAETMRTDPPPYIPGMEIAGIVDEIGEGTDSEFSIGDKVLGIVVTKGAHGGYREQIVLNTKSVVRMPEGKTYA